MSSCIDEDVCEGYHLLGKATVTRQSADGTVHVFVQRAALRGSRWLRFVRKVDAPGWWVTCHRTKRDAVLPPPVWRTP